MRITTRSRYGLQAIVCIARGDKRPVSGKEISQSEDIPRKYVDALLQRLRKEGFIKSRKGRSGGYVLAALPRETYVSDIVSALEGDVGAVPCLVKNATCKRAAQCSTKSVWEALSLSVERTLGSITLGDILHPELRIGAEKSQREEGSRGTKEVGPVINARLIWLRTRK